jgi:hypothetical protein
MPSDVSDGEAPLAAISGFAPTANALIDARLVLIGRQVFADMPWHDLGLMDPDRCPRRVAQSAPRRGQLGDKPAARTLDLSRIELSKT